ncbi:hypothetical protein [Mammaliicoccus sp. E-M25]|uniref:hypothetical protein n=1 Tax=Mammaliicoccus sp. E-M25 TaxID=2898685 RepID=UPI001EFB7EF2|nr:hypothetical protein [Mammaliicoccus sp. E-M25]
MPTIKRKVEMNLPQLIEWLLESGKSECIVISNMNNIVQLEPYGVIRFSQEKFYPEETFTVKVEEEITEDTVIDNLIEINELIDFKKEGLLGGVRLYKNSSINQVENDKSVAYYIMNDDLEMTLIWKRKEGLVE